MNNLDNRRLIEAAFPLKQASIDSVHEKNVRHGHISTLHIWPARRPLAACRAALIATLLPDPGSPEERKKLVERIGGTVVEGVKKKKMPNGRIEELHTEETLGGVLHWGRESNPDMEWFRAKIRETYGGRAPKVLDPFAGGGAIPLEAMRLGCEVTASDINPVAWLILKCTLQFPQKLAGQKRRLPEFILKDRDFMVDFLKAQGFKGAMLRSQLGKIGLDDTASPLLAGMAIDGSNLEADLAWHVRAWGQWVLERARRDLAPFYPTYSDFQSVDGIERSSANLHSRIVTLNSNGTPDLESLNAEFSKEYLAEKRNARWVPKPTVAYLWARSIECKHCRATVPLLKTRWLSKVNGKRIVLRITPNDKRTEVNFSIETAPTVGTNPAQRREHDKRIGAGTMSGSGVKCPCCDGMSSMEDIRSEARTGRLGMVLTTVVVDGGNGKEYRLPTVGEREASFAVEEQLTLTARQMPFGLPTESLPSKDGLGIRAPLYGLTRWTDLFTKRQQLTLSTFCVHVRSATSAMPMETETDLLWAEAIAAYLSVSISRLADYSSTICLWALSEFICHTFTRYALPMTWDFVEGNPISATSGNYAGGIDWIARVVSHLLEAEGKCPAASIMNVSSITIPPNGNFDLVLTDPPYYDAISYSDLMDFFYVWLRRSLSNLSVGSQLAFENPLSPKWDHTSNDGELIDDASRFGGNHDESKAAYETGMYRAFEAIQGSLAPTGHLAIVFAHKHPDAWEALASALIRAGFVVCASWPIKTEREARIRAYASAALASSIWLVCNKRSETARPGWDNRVLEEMREKITTQLREFWDAGIRGPDFVWAATGPALEAYSKHPVVRKVNAPGELMTVSEFLGHVRRMVVDFVVGRVLSPVGEGEAATGLDSVTAYYLLHRHDFGLGDAPVGACILYAVSCDLADRDLADKLDLIAHSGRTQSSDNEFDGGDEVGDEDVEASAANAVKLKGWNQRRRKSLGQDDGGGGAIPLIDQIHRLMQLWQTGSVVDVNAYLEERGLRSNSLFPKVLQALVELADRGTDERSILETIAKHVRELGESRQIPLPVS